MIHVLLVDDQVSICQILQEWLSEEEDFDVVGYANNGQKALELIEDLKPNIVIMDVEMPGMDGVTTTEIISQRFVKVSVIIFSGNDNYENLARSLQVGAKGYILKGAQKEEIVQTVRSVHKGYSQLEPRLIEKILELSQQNKQFKEYVEEARMMLKDTERMQKRLQNDYDRLRHQFVGDLNQLQKELTNLQEETRIVENDFTQIKEKILKNSQELKQTRKYLIIIATVLFIILLLLIF